MCTFPCVQVTVNLWLTEDDANLDPDSGGLVVYDVEPPSDWSFEDVNRNTPLIEEALGQGGDAGDGGLSDEELDALIEDALAQGATDEQARAEILKAHPEWTPEQVDAELAKAQNAGG